MKTNPTLGREVQQHLIEQQVETPMTKHVFDKSDKKALVEGGFRAIMNALGLDLKDDSLKDTPRRVADMYIDEMFSGLDYDNFPKATAVKNYMHSTEMLTVNNISLQSNCEHHFVIIDGFCKIAYIPKADGDLLGLSKLNRIVQFFARRPQIQERLTLQIFHALQYILKIDDIAVSITATHFCVKARGVNDTHSDTTTSKLGGRFMNSEVRAEFFNK